ncbi:acetaldehyde dehydrogenase (acetylating) [Micromonospora radicis]|uniref:Acetaldehyde dehydrogenase n=1 Tax=Micromonospora radicis TaxID=1894971 RepID=A0A418MWF9_9ACTN|nr:acetaldehyde dehydrogenase (acetylating) [Micromonospora radicis]RIV39221.1 acetaldehyde dehydrogenase (acetylating) [Micromonospora radicis]
MVNIRGADTPTDRLRCAVVGSGNIGSDLLLKLRRSTVLEPRLLVGIDPASDGLRRARRLGIEATAGGVDALLAAAPDIDLVFEATSAAAHLANAPRYRAAGLTVLDLTPAAVGPYVVPAVNLTEVRAEPNLNLVTCGGQATVPIVAAISRIAPVSYAEIVATIASRAAGPGTRANIDEFTETTADALCRVGGAARGKAIIILNPADPPLIMRNTVFAAVAADTDVDAVTESIERMVETVQGYVPGYRMSAPVQITPRGGPDGGLRVSVFLQVTGAADYLPSYAGNLDIITAAAIATAERIRPELKAEVGA